MRRALQTTGGELADAAQHPATAQLIENIITEIGCQTPRKRYARRCAGSWRTSLKHPVRPERIGIAYRSPSPYARMFDEQLGVAGLPFHVSSGRRLADSVTGRTVLRVLALRSQDYPRGDVIAWLADAPVRTAEGKAVPLATWDRLSRDAGVSRSHRLWRDRLARHAGDVTRRRDHMQDASPVASEHELDEQKTRYDRRIQECAHLDAFIDDLVAQCDAVASAASWAEVAAALRAAVHRFLGGPTTADR